MSNSFFFFLCVRSVCFRHMLHTFCPCKECSIIRKNFHRHFCILFFLFRRHGFLHILLCQYHRWKSCESSRCPNHKCRTDCHDFFVFIVFFSFIILLDLAQKKRTDPPCHRVIGALFLSEIAHEKSRPFPICRSQTQLIHKHGCPSPISNLSMLLPMCLIILKKLLFSRFFGK